MKQYFRKLNRLRFLNLLGLFVPVLFSISFPALSQSTKYFEKVFSTPYPFFEEGWHVNSLIDGYALSCGRAVAPSGITQAFAMKVDLSGNLNWEFLIQDTSSSNGFLSGCVVNDGFVHTGFRYDLATGKDRTLICKIDSSGNQLWQKLIGDTIKSNFIRSIGKTSDGGFILSGHIEQVYWEGYVIKTDSLGNVEWTRQFNGPLIDDLWSIQQLGDGSFISSGYTNYALGSGSVRIIKMDTQGFQVWDSSYTFQNNTQIGRSIINSVDGGYIVGGITGSSVATTSGLIFKIDSSKSILWSKILTEFSNGTGNPYVSRIMSLKELADSSIICVGSIVLTTGLPQPTDNKLLLLKLDKFGNEIWRRIYAPMSSGDTYGEHIDLASDGGFIMSGRTESPNNADVYLLKTNCLGFITAPVANFDYSVIGTNVTFQNLSQFSDTCVYYFGDGDSLLITHTDTIPVVHNYSSQGWFNAYMVAYACGENDSIQIPLYTGIDNGYEFIVNSFTLNPNPTTDFLSINYRIPKNVKTLKLICLDITGRLIKELLLDPNDTDYTMDVADFSPGSYMLYLQPDVLRVIGKKLIVLK